MDVLHLILSHSWLCLKPCWYVLSGCFTVFYTPWVWTLDCVTSDCALYLVGVNICVTSDCFKPCGCEHVTVWQVAVFWTLWVWTRDCVTSGCALDPVGVNTWLCDKWLCCRPCWCEHLTVWQVTVFHTVWVLFTGCFRSKIERFCF